MDVSDVNEISYFDGIIVGGCDDGGVYCVSSKTGELKWLSKLDSGVVSKIHKYVGYGINQLIVTCFNGAIYFLSLINGEILNKIVLEGNVMSNIEFVNSGSNQVLYIPTINGVLYELTEKFDSFEITNQTTIYYPDKWRREGYSIATLYAPPLIYNGKIFLGLTRQTYYDYPAVVCLDLSSKNVLWYASDPNKMVRHFGNIRTNLIADNGQIVFTHPYSNELVGINESDGEIKWITNLGRPMFQQWASPAQSSNGYFLSRYDGYLYKVYKSSKHRHWGMYLGQSDDAGVVFDSSQQVGNENERAAWELFKGFSLISTPAFYNNNIIVGSDEGILYCISNI